MHGPPASDVIRRFYAAREAQDAEQLRPFLADDVVWREPTVGSHMGELRGADAVIDMIARALETTAGTFSLGIAEVLEVQGHCTVLIEWSAQKRSELVRGRELAVFSVVDGRIVFAQFLPENIANDNVFWS